MARPKSIPEPFVSEPTPQTFSATQEPPTNPSASGFVPLTVNTSNEREVEVMRFKSDVQKVKRNSAWKKGEIKLEEIEHRHYWDTISRSGTPNTHCVAKNGHTHAVSYELSPDGKSIKVNCGPALKEKNSSGTDGKSRRTFEPPFLYVTDDPINGGTMRVNDTHTHTISYMKTEKHMLRSN